MLNVARQFIIRLFPIFFAGAASILFIMHRVPLPTLTMIEPGFSTCHLPCWAGVTLYETGFRDSVKIITANLPNWDVSVQGTNAQYGFYANQDQKQVGGVVYEDRGSVGRMRLDMIFPLRYLLDTLGRPYCVRANHLSSIDVDVVLVYWRLGDSAAVGVMKLDPPERWSPGVSIESLLILSSYEECSLFDAQPWRGFARLWHYQTNNVD